MKYDKRNLQDPDPEVSTLVNALVGLHDILMQGIPYEAANDGERSGRIIKFTPAILNQLKLLDTKLERLVEAVTTDLSIDPSEMISGEQLESLRSSFVAIATPFIRKSVPEKDSLSASLESRRQACDGAFARIADVAEDETIKFRSIDADALNRFFRRMERIDASYGIIEDFLTAPTHLPSHPEGLEEFQKKLAWHDMKQFALRLHKIYSTAVAINELIKGVREEIEELVDLDNSSHLEEVFNTFLSEFISARRTNSPPPFVPIEIIAHEGSIIDELLEQSIELGEIPKDLAGELWIQINAAKEDFQKRIDEEVPPFNPDDEHNLGRGLLISVRANSSMLEVQQAFRKSVFHGDDTLPNWVDDVAGELTPHEVEARAANILEKFAALGEAAKNGRLPISPPPSGPGSVGSMARGVLTNEVMWTGNQMQRDKALAPVNAMLAHLLPKRPETDEGD